MQEFILLLLLALSASAAEVSPQKFEVDKDLTFNLYTLKNPIEPQIIFINDIKSINESNFDQLQPTRIFAHGFYSKGELRKNILDGYFTKGKRNVNLIEVNWENASHTINYVAAASYVPQIGEETAKLVDFLVNSKLLNLSDLTVIGFSLGAHIAGITGKRVTVGKLPKIIALDPAQPLFSVNTPEKRLDRTDALYVETVHTSKLGFFKPLGHVNFYANGGRTQPKCSWDIVGKCSHQTAYKYFALSIYSDRPLVGHMCKSLDEVSNGTCITTHENEIAEFGGEPGALKQWPGIYYLPINYD